VRRRPVERRESWAGRVEGPRKQILWGLLGYLVAGSKEEKTLSSSLPSGGDLSEWGRREGVSFSNTVAE